MKKLLATTLGLVLATGAASALAGKQDRANLELCKADIEAYYGEGTRTRLRSIKRDDDDTHMRLMVNPQGGSNVVVVCSVAADGVSSLADGDGVALVASVSEETVSLVQ